MFSLVWIMSPRVMTRSAGRPAAESLGGGTGERVGRGGRGRRPREGNDERIDELNGQGNDQGLGANGGAPDFSTIIAQQLQNLLPSMLAQVSNRGNVGNKNGNVVNENVGNVIVNGNRVGCSYMEFLACKPKEYDGKGGYQDNIQAYVSAAAVNYNQGNAGHRPPSQFTVANPKGDLKAITTRSGVSYDGPPIPPPFSFLQGGGKEKHEVLRGQRGLCPRHKILKSEIEGRRAKSLGFGLLQNYLLPRPSKEFGVF
ncbi:hypothetical protein Tco_1285249 [Tanacetum coccineum]